MQLKIKQIGSSLMGAVLTGATLLGGALAADISDYQKMTPSDTVIVVGAAAASSDVVGAINIGADLFSNGVTATATTGTAAATTVSGGVNLATGSQPLYLTNPLSKAKTTLASADLPTTLAAGVFTDNAGSTYKYNQYLYLGGSSSLQYGKQGTLTDPTDILFLSNGGASSSSYIYYAQASFTDPILLDSTNVKGKTIQLFGTTYTIGSDSTSNTTTPQLVLFGSANTMAMNEGDSSTVNVGGTPYTVKLISVSDSQTANVQVGSDIQSVTKGSSKQIGGVTVFLNDVFYNPKQGTVSSAKISVGSNKITLKNADNVRTGVSATIVSGTYVSLGTDSSGRMNSLIVYVNAPDTNSATVTEGGSFTDPVFGSFKLSFSGYTPSASASDTARDTVTETTSGNNRVTVSITDYFGNSKTLEFARNSNTGTPTANDQLLLQDGNSKVIHVIEGEAAALNEYIVADAGANIIDGDFSHLFKVTSIPSNPAAGGTQATIQDYLTGSSITFNLNATGAGNTVIDGQTYWLQDVSPANTTVQLTWTAGSRSGVGPVAAGSETTIYPGLRLKNSEWMYFIAPNQSVTLTSGTPMYIKLPTGWLNATYIAGGPILQFSSSTASASTGAGTTRSTATGGAINAGGYAISIGQQQYNLTWPTNTTATALPLNISLADGNGNPITQPAVLIREPKSGSASPDATTYDTITLKTSVAATTGVLAPAPLFSNTGATSSNQSAGSSTSTSVTRYMDVWGTIAAYDSSSQGKVTLSVPAQQLTANLYVLTAAATAPTAAAAGNAVVVLPSLGSGIGKLDSEISAEKTTKNLVLVGGPYANTLVKELADKGKTPTKAEWSANLQGKAIIQVIGDAFAPGKTALVVAGWSADDSRVAALKFASDNTMKGMGLQEIGGVWSAFTYPFAAAAPATTANATTPATGNKTY